MAALIALTTGCTAGHPEELPVADSELREYLGVIELAAQEAGPEATVRRSVQREEAIADCMGRLGFDYVPMPTTAEAQGITDTDFYLGMGTLEWVQQNGYGVSTNPVYTALESDAAEDSDGPDSATDADSSARPELLPERDPNVEILEALSVSEQAAYQLALHGDDYALGDEEPEYADGSGCAAEAEASLPMDPADLLMNVEVAEIYTAIAVMTGKIEEDSEVQAAARAWSACMSERGHVDLLRPSEAVASIEEQLDVLVRGHADADAAGEDSEPGEPGSAAVSTYAESLQQLNREEVALATADVQCSASTGLDDVRGSVQVRLENEYVQQHREGLERVRLAIAEYSG